jgi:hypothetical protein
MRKAPKPFPTAPKRRRLSVLTMPRCESEHIAFPRIWEFSNLNLDLRPTEYNHLHDCNRCRAAFRACVGSKSLEEAKENLRETF